MRFVFGPKMYLDSGNKGRNVIGAKEENMLHSGQQSKTNAIGLRDWNQPNCDWLLEIIYSVWFGPGLVTLQQINTKCAKLPCWNFECKDTLGIDFSSGNVIFSWWYQLCQLIWFSNWCLEFGLDVDSGLLCSPLHAFTYTCTYAISSWMKSNGYIYMVFFVSLKTNFVHSCVKATWHNINCKIWLCLVKDWTLDLHKMTPMPVIHRWRTNMLSEPPKHQEKSECYTIVYYIWLFFLSWLNSTGVWL